MLPGHILQVVRTAPRDRQQLPEMRQHRRHCRTLGRCWAVSGQRSARVRRGRHPCSLRQALGAPRLRRYPRPRKADVGTADRSSPECAESGCASSQQRGLQAAALTPRPSPWRIAFRHNTVRRGKVAIVTLPRLGPERGVRVPGARWRVAIPPRTSSHAPSPSAARARWSTRCSKAGIRCFPYMLKTRPAALV